MINAPRNKAVMHSPTILVSAAHCNFLCKVNYYMNIVKFNILIFLLINNPLLFVSIYQLPYNCLLLDKVITASLAVHIKPIHPVENIKDL